MNVFRMNWVLTAIPGSLPKVGYLEAKRGIVL